MSDPHAWSALATEYEKEELDRLTDLWKQSRKESHRKQKELELLKKKWSLQEQSVRQEAAELRTQVENLRAELTASQERELDWQTRYSRSKEERRLLKAQLKAVGDEVRHTREAMKGKDHHLETQVETNTRLASLIDNIIGQREAWVKEETVAEAKLQAEVSERDDTIRKLRAEVASLSAGNEALRKEQEDACKKMTQLEQAVKDAQAKALDVKHQLETVATADTLKLSEIQRLRQQTDNQSKEISALTAKVLSGRASTLVNDSSESMKARIQLLEAELGASQTSQRRVMRLLSTTKEYGTEFTCPTSDGDMAFFVPDTLDDTTRIDAALNKRDLNPPVCRSEADYWIPAEVFRLANQFILAPKSDSSARSFSFGGFLVAINRVWKNKEARARELLADAYKRELQIVRRKLRGREELNAELLSVRQILEMLKRDVAASKVSSKKQPGKLADCRWRPLQLAVSQLEAVLEKLSLTQTENTVLQQQIHAHCGDTCPTTGRGQGRMFEAEKVSETIDDLLHRTHGMCLDFERCVYDMRYTDSQRRHHMDTIVAMHRDFTEMLRHEIANVGGTILSLRQDV